jgi:hypothetical protein
MTKTARIDRASGTNVGERKVALRLGRRLRSDPHVLLALALAIPTIVVNFLDQGPDELAVTILAIAFLAIQTGLTAVGLSLGLGESRHSNRALLTSGSVPVIDAWSLLRLILAVGFVALAAYATADPTSVPLAPLYIPVNRDSCRDRPRRDGHRADRRRNRPRCPPWWAAPERRRP